VRVHGGWRGEKLAKRRKKPYLPNLTKLAQKAEKEDTAYACGA